MRRAALAVVMLLGATVLVACAKQDAGNGPPDVRTTVISDPATQDVRVFEPDAEGQWPVVVALHGLGGTGQDMDELATRLARQGALVFAPTYHTDLTTRKGVVQAATDIECGYRFIRTVAADYGGDLDQPVILFGWSLGASAALAIGLTEDIDPTGKHISCFSNAPRPDVIVASSGCYFEFEGVRQDTFDLSGWGNEEAGITLLAGDEDTTCAAWQSQKAQAKLRAAGYQVGLVMLDGANHPAPIFHDEVDGQWVVRSDDPPGERAVTTILDAIAAEQDRSS